MKRTSELLLTFLVIGLHFNVLHGQENLTELYYAGSYEEVVEGSARLINSGDTAFSNFQLKALSEAQLGQNPEAINTLLQALRLHPENPIINRMLAGQYFEAGNYVLARESYTSLIEEDSTDISAWMKLAEMASFGQQYEEAIVALNRVLALDSINLGSLMMMGDILNRYGSAGAWIFYDRAYRLYPDNQKAAYALGNWFIQYKKPHQAIPVCQHMIELDSSSIKFSKLLAYAYYKTGQAGQAVEWFDYAINLGDSTAFTLKFKGISHYLRSDFGAAIGALEGAVKKDSMDAEVHFFLGASLATIAEMGAAMEHLDQSLELMQPDPTVISRIYSEQGNIMRLKEEYDKAYKLYEQAWKVDSTSVISLYFMASILDNSMHKPNEALKDYQRYIEALDKLPDDSESSQSVSIRAIVEDRIITLKEEQFFRDE